MEEKLLQALWQVVDKLPTPYKILALGFGLAVWPVYKFLKSEDAQKVLLSRIKKKADHLSGEQLQENSLFANAVLYKQKIRSITFSDDCKTEAFRTLLCAKLESDVAVLTEFLNDKDFNKQSTWDIVQLLKNLVEQLTEDADIAILAAYETKFGREKAETLFDFVMNSEDGFRSKRGERINMLLQIVDIYIQHSPVYHTQNERIYSFIDKLNIAVYMAIFHAEGSFEKFNGQIRRIMEGDAA